MTALNDKAELNSEATELEELDTDLLDEVNGGFLDMGRGVVRRNRLNTPQDVDPADPTALR